MPDSILDDVKKVLGIDSSYEAFDLDIMMHINSTFATLHQLGVGDQDSVFAITDSQAVWSDFIRGVTQINMVKSYIVMKVRLAFDPPTTSFAIAALEKQIEEFEFRLNVQESLFTTEEV